MQNQPLLCTKVGKQFKCHVDQCDRSFTSWQGWQYHYLNKHTNIRNPCSTLEEEVTEDIPSKELNNEEAALGTTDYGDAFTSSNESTPEREFVDMSSRKRPSFKNEDERPPKSHKDALWSLSRKSSHVTCDLCGKKLSSASNLKVHKNTLHFGQRWRCRICGRTCTSKESVVKTCKKMHEGEDVEFLKPEINQEESSPGSSDISETPLGDPDELAALECIQSIVSLSKSKAVDQQTGEEEATDTDSEPNFSAESYESDHWCEEDSAQVEYGRKPICHICGKRFASNSSLKVHKNILHFGKRWRCRICGRVCTKKQNVQATCKRHHLGEDIEVISLTEADYAQADTMEISTNEPVILESPTPWAKEVQLMSPKA